MVWNDKKLLKVLKQGGVAVMPTDTLYGIVGKAGSEFTVNRIYVIRQRNPDKPCIILIGDVKELEKFSIVLSKKQKAKLKEYWFTSSGVERPRPVSIVFDCPDDAFAYLHRGTRTLAFRLPAPESLRTLLLKTGPLIAPSANTEKFPASENIQDARGYFGDAVDIYIDGGPITAKASKVIRLYSDGSVTVLRP